MAQLWLRGAAYTTVNASNSEERTGVAVYQSEYMCRQFEDAPMFVIPLHCGQASDILVPDDLLTLRLGVIPVPLTAEPHPLDKE